MGSIDEASALEAGSWRVARLSGVAAIRTRDFEKLRL